MRQRLPLIFALLAFAATVLFFQATVTLAKVTEPNQVVEEGGFVENSQLAFALLSAGGLAILSRRCPRQRGLLLLMAALGMLACLRELNNSEWYQRVFFFRGASWLFGLAIAGVIAWRHRTRLLGQISELSRTSASALFAAGFAVTIGWAQVLAQKPLFVSREADRIVEETLEAAGYLLIFFGVLQLFFEWRGSQFSERRAGRQELEAAAKE